MNARIARICGVDTGPRQHAYGIVDVEPVGAYADGSTAVQYRYVESAMLPWPESMESGVLLTLAEADAIAVECPQHAYSAATASPIIETARAAGELVGVMRGVIRSAGPPRRVVVAYTTAAEWRRELLGAANAHDAAIKAWLHEHVAGMPRKSNAHTRDALAIACWAAKAVRR